MKEGRWYQTYCVNKVAHHLENGIRRIHIDLPTGAGKTFTAALIANDGHVRALLGVPATRKLRMLWVAHKHRLLKQAYNEITTFSPATEIYMQSAFSSIDVDVNEFDVVVIDECHHEAMMSIPLKLSQLMQKPIIGLTATDERADGTLIKFEVTIKPLTREQAVAEGWLAETHLRTVIDYENTKQKHTAVINVLREFHDLMGKTLIFMPYRSQVRAVAAALIELGYPVEVLLDQNDVESDAVLERFSRGETQFIVNCNKINEGVDVRGCTDVVLGRQYGSEPELNQVIGRAARPDSPCRVWEFLSPIKQSLTALNIVGTPEKHELFYHDTNGNWQITEFFHAEEIC